MSSPAYSFLEAGTPLTWTSSGGDKVLTLTSMTANVAREGDKSASLVDGTKGMPELVEIRMETKVGSAAANGTYLDLYIGESDSATAGTANPGGLTGADAAVATPAEKTLQLRLVGIMPMSNVLGTGLQVFRTIYYPVCAYLIPVVVNSTGQTLSGTGTDHKVIITPYYRKIPY